MVDVLIASYPQIGFCCKLYRMNYFNHFPKYNWQISTFKMNSGGRISKQQFREWRVLLGTSTEIRFWMKTPRLWNFDNKTFSLNQRTLTTWSLQKMQENIKPNLVQVSLKTILICEPYNCLSKQLPSSRNIWHWFELENVFCYLDL